MMKTFLLCLIIIITLLTSGYRKPHQYVINAEKDAYFHNNVGLNYLKDRVYYAAIQEFKIAIQLSPNTQATAVFQSNLGDTYLFIGYPDLAKICFEDAIKKYPLNFNNYIKLAKCYKELNIVAQKIKELQFSNKIYNKILLGLLYIENNELRRGVNILDEICYDEPDILITPAIKQYLNDILKNSD